MTSTSGSEFSETPTSAEVSGRFERWTSVALAIVAYVPILLTAPGRVSADTKAYLLLDPGGLLSRAPYMWDSHIDAGTVTHQNIGYLFPLGPWYWVFDTLGVPTWIAERLWFGTLLFAAGAGTRWMLRRLGMRGPGAAVAAFVYMLSPYLLAYMGRTSVILTPWCALPWLIGLMVEALRERTWRAPVLFALIVTVMAGTNASSVIFVLLGPILFVPFAVWVTGETDVREALRTLIRLAVSTGPAQLWWLSGLYIQGRYGLPILQLTETVETVAQTSTSPEVLRGLGYWYFYGRDGLASWTESGPLYTTTLVMLPLTFVLPLLGLLGALLTRWKYRAYFVLLILVGLIFAIGTYPYRDPSPVGAIIKFTTSLEVGFALRNSPRIVPLVAIGLAALLASLVDALIPALRQRLRPPWNRRIVIGLPIALIGVAVLNLPPLWTGGFVQSDLEFPETLPTYWTDAAAWLDAQGDDRVLELPGADFGAYRWGETQDPLTPGLVQRPWIGREITAYGTPATVDLLRALDRPWQEGVGEASAVAGIARLFSASDVLLRLDSQFERYRAPRPADLWNQFGANAPGDGLGAPTIFGTTGVNTADPRQPMIDEQRLATSGTSDATPPLAVYPVDDVRPLVRAESTESPTVVFGDGDGIVEAATWNQIPRERALFYAATATASAPLMNGIRSSRPRLVITDTNRRRAQRWGTTRENNGATETATSTPLVEDPKDTRLDLFPGETAADQSVAWFGDDVANVRATTYGNIVAYSSEVRPVNAIDGDPRTAWTTGGFSDVIGDRLVIDYTRDISADHIELIQTRGNRWITRATVLLDGVPAATVDLTDASFTSPGQRVDLGGMRSFSSLTIRIDDASITGRTTWLGISNVGLREVTVPGVSAQEWIVTPSAGVDELAPAATSVSYDFARLRSNPVEGFRQDTELQLRRIFRVGSAGTFAIAGRARLASGVNGAVIDTTVGRPGLSAGYAEVGGTDYLDGVLTARPSSALDGDPATAWTTRFDDQVGASALVTAPGTMTFDRLRLTVRNDAEHSVPTSLLLTLDDGSMRTVRVPDIPTIDAANSVATIEIPTGTISSRTVRVAIAAERAVTTKEYFSGTQRILPISIAEFGLPVTVGPLPDRLPTTCRSGLVTIDGTDRPVVMAGSVAAAIDREALELVACDQQPRDLSAGDHRLVTAKGADVGIDVDAIGLHSVPSVQDSAPTAVPTTTATETGTNSYRIDIANATQPFWLVLGQSVSEGWKAQIRGGDSLGPPTLIDGFASGWLIDPDTTGSGVTVDITWSPQRTVWLGIMVSAIWFSGLCLSAIVAWWRRRHSPRLVADTAPSELNTSDRHDGLPTRTRILTLFALTALAAFVGGTGVAIAILTLSALALWTRRRLAVLTLGMLGCIGGIVVLYTGLQVKRAYPAGVEWPSGFLVAHQLGLIAVLLVVVESLTRFLLRTRSKTTQSASDASQMSDGSALTR